MKFLFITFAVVVSSFASQAQTTMQLVWSDSFTNNNINTSNWKFEIGTGSSGWGNNELQFYTNRPENAFVANGNLHIVAKKESYLGSDYTSARMITKGLQSWTYGKIEARIQLPQTQGLWPAFWTLGNNIDQVSWPTCGEIDILEHINLDPKIHGTMHWNNNGHVLFGGSTNCNVTQYHIYAIEWNKDSIKWLLDNQVYHTALIKNNINNTGAFHKPFFLLLNMAVGGNWPGNPTPFSVFPDTMRVDYINVYQLGYPTSITNEISSNSNFEFFPNPCESILNIQYSADAPATIELYNMLGIRVLRQELNKDENYSSFQIAELPKGIYAARIIKNGQYLSGTRILKK